MLYCMIHDKRYDQLSQKKTQLDAYRPLPEDLLRNLDDWFRVELTYTSNAIEGNTLTRRETALVIEKGITVGGKTVVEHLEATNHVHALDWVKDQVSRLPVELRHSDILKIHGLILAGIDHTNAGRYRNIPVRISGSSVVLPNPRKVPDLMDEFINWLTGSEELHPVQLAAEAHYRLVSIHPFVDGNGRTARLLMNMILMMSGYPIAIIRKQDRLAYITALEKAQLGGSTEDYLNLIVKSLHRSFDLYLNAVQGKDDISDPSDSLLRIGELAKQVNQTNSTIRHWTKEGLLTVLEHTHSGYHLYGADMIERIKTIQKLKAKRLSLGEIRDQLSD